MNRMPSRAQSCRLSRRSVLAGLAVAGASTGDEAAQSSGLKFATGGEGGGFVVYASAFVDAVIEGREVADVVKLPRAALTGEGTVFVVGKDDALETRAVEVLRADEELAWVSSGLAAGERVCAHAPSALSPGTRVRMVAPAKASP